ncbi:MAG: DUF2935 domain-containing protein [Pyrinomonadaceae bacterium]|nr:DUF2935 domain-containing protein [Pyrinomonadaceae bacterium]
MNKTAQNEPSGNQSSPRITRREVLVAGGATLIGTTLLGSLFDTVQAQTMTGQDMKRRGITSKDGGMKPTFLPEQGSTDAVAFSVAENLFWNEQLMEHAKFFVMMMPGLELAAQRGQAEQFQNSFMSQLQKAQTASLDRSNYAAFNRSTVELVKPFVDFKRQMRDEQAAGKLKSLVWSTFFDHTAREAERFSKRLDQFSRGDTSTSLSEAADFWTQIMGEHADFIAHLLDPVENTLIQKAIQTSGAFKQMHSSSPASKNPLEKAVNDIIDFKTAAEKGINAGQIKSIIHPTLADHVRREALKAADELKRAA